MLDAINAAVAREAAAELAKRKAVVAEAKANIAAVNELLPDLRAIAPVAARLVQLGIGREPGGFFNMFKTDGVSHRWGFANLFNRAFDYFGREAGGVCGPGGIYVNIHSGKWTWMAEKENGKDVFEPEMTGDEFAEFAATPRVNIMGCVIEEKRYFICDSLARMANGINGYFARVEKAVRELSGAGALVK